MIDQTTPELCPLGVNGILVRFSRVLSEEGNQKTIAFQSELVAQNVPGITEISTSLASVLVQFDPEVVSRKALQETLNETCNRMTSAASGPKRLWRIPVAFGPNYAPQLAEAAALAGLSPQAAVADIVAQTVRVMAIGFAPGQPYLGMLPEHWNIPRQTTLTEHMPNGALVTAVRQLILFSASAPTGWRHIGQSAFRVYRPETQDPFPLRAGDAVQFAQVSDAEFAAIRSNTDTNGGAACTVLP